MTAPFATELPGWKPSKINKLNWPLLPNFADVDNTESLRIAAGLLDQLAILNGGRYRARRRPAGPASPAGPARRTGR